jgi:hypothetical protein
MELLVAIQFPLPIRPMAGSIFRWDFSPNTSSSVVAVAAVASITREAAEVVVC